MPQVANSPHEALDRLKPHWRVRNIIPSLNFILSNTRYKSHQIILEGVAYE